jgi:hypothetical protein
MAAQTTKQMTQIFTPEHKAKLEEYLATHKKLTVGVLAEGHLNSRGRLRCLVGLGRYVSRPPSFQHKVEEVLADAVNTHADEVLALFEDWWNDVLCNTGLWIGLHGYDGACYGVWDIRDKPNHDRY